METTPAPPPPPRTAKQEDQEEDVMPLLFMENLPSDFQRNAALAALVTFMGSDDDDATNDEDIATGKRSSVRTRRETRRKARQPYARVKGDAKNSAEEPGAKDKEATNRGAQELALYLNMFHVSSE